MFFPWRFANVFLTGTACNLSCKRDSNLGTFLGNIPIVAKELHCTTLLTRELDNGGYPLVFQFF